MRIAFFSPLPPERSGIADYSYELLEELRHHLDVTAVVRDDLVTVDRAPDGVEVVGLSSVVEEEFACSVYQMGNNPKYHRFFFQRALEQPGLLVMHDPSLADFHAEMCRYEDSGTFRAEIAYDTPEIGLDDKLPRVEAAPGQFDLDRLRVLLSRRIVESNIRTLVHSSAVAAELRRRYPGADVATIQLPAQVLDLPARAEERPPGDVVFGVFGGINYYKRIDAVVEAFRGLHEEFPLARLVIAGRPDDREMTARLQALATGPELDGRLEVKTELSLAELEAEMVACDVAISLRWPTAGEMSATLMRTFGAGRPAVVTDVLQFRELDDRFCWRVPVEPDLEAPALLEVMRSAAADPARCVEAGLLAKQFVAHEATYRQVSEQYVEHVEACRGRRAARTRARTPYTLAANAVLGVNLWARSPEGTDERAAVAAACGLLVRAGVDVVDGPGSRPVRWRDEGYESRRQPVQSRQLARGQPRSSGEPTSLVAGLGASTAGKSAARRVRRALEPQGRARGRRYEVEGLHEVDLCFASPAEARQMSRTARDAHLRGRRLVAALAVDVFPLGAPFAGLFHEADQVWVPSTFSADVARGHTSAPVVVVPWPAAVALEVAAAAPGPPQLPTFDGVTFLAVADGHTGLARGNPWGAISAFQRAFPGRHRDRCRLVVAARRLALPEARERLHAELALVGGLLLEDLDDRQLAGAVREADVLVSLHRTESFGVWPAAAMMLGIPVLATAYGGNLDYMSGRTASLVAFQMARISAGDFYLDVGQVAYHDWDQYWAQPDLDQAAQWMRRLQASEGLRARLAAAARSGAARCFAAEPLQCQMAEVLRSVEHDAPRDLVVRYLEAERGLSWSA